MNRKLKIVAGIVVVAVAVVTVAVVLVVTRTPKPNVVGIYTGQNGREIHLAKDGTLTVIGLQYIGTATRVPMRYWVTGNNITVGTGESKSPPKGPTTFKIEGYNRLVGCDTVWVKHTVEPNRPSSLVGTYTSTASDGQTLALDKNGAIYVTQPLPTGETVGDGTWVADRNVVTVTYGVQKMTYTINGKSLVGGGKELVKTSDRAIVPATL
jgi:hypothetical protein